MPGIVLFRRRWSIGSDDVIIPASILAVTSLIWIIVLGAMIPTFLHEISDSSQTTSNKKFWFLIIANIAIIVVCLVTEICMCVFSLRGRIMYDKPRWPVAYFVYARLLLFILQIIAGCIALVWVRIHGFKLKSSRAVLGLIIFQFILLAILVLAAWDHAGKKFVKYRKRSRKTREEKIEEAYEKSWRNRCQLLCCCISFKHEYKDSMHSVSEVFSGLFKGEDIVPTDIVAGMLLLRHRQQDELEEKMQNGSCTDIRSSIAITPSMTFLNPQDPSVKQKVSEMKHFMAYCWGTYGWPHFLISNNCTGYFRWLSNLDYCFCTPETIPNAEVEGADCCLCNYSALKNTLPETVETEIIFITYKSRVGETPFMVATDHTQKAIVICCRGTRSLEDAVTDVLCTPVHIPLKQQIPDYFGHEGCTNAGAYMYSRIIEERMIERAQERKRTEEPYRVIVIGHSLGAGTAPLLAILLRQDYPDLYCYAFSPPGALLSTSAVEYSKSFITTVIAGEDLVPRVGLPQLQKFRQGIVSELDKTSNSKWRIITSGVSQCIPQPKRDVDNFDGIPTAGDQETQGRTTRLRALHYVEDGKQVDEAPEQLYLPGNIMHAVKGQNEEWSAYWAANEGFQEIIISADMLNDHRGDTVLNVLGALIGEQ